MKKFNIPRLNDLNISELSLIGQNLKEYYMEINNNEYIYDIDPLLKLLPNNLEKLQIIITNFFNKIKVGIIYDYVKIRLVYKFSFIIMI